MFQNYFFISQDAYDLRLMYAGETWERKDIDYPCNLSHYLIKDNRMRFFINVPTWIDFLTHMDFSVGMKIHGSVAATLAGTPAFLIVHDSRTRELAEYHNIPHIKYTEINENTNPYTIYESTDFSKIEIGHKERFSNFVSFLNENGLENVYEKGEDSLLDKKIAEIKWESYVKPIIHTDSDEMIDRLNIWSDHTRKKISNLREKIKKLSQ